MTTIVAWAAVDQRQVSSLYIASDSRITWGTSHLWDQGLKTFASATTPHIFGYWGDVLFPSMALTTIVEHLAAGAFRERASAFADVSNALRRLWLEYPSRERRDFGIIMATRRRDKMKSVFEMAVVTYDASADLWATQNIEMPERSSRLKIAGSGAAQVRAAEQHWEESEHAGTSRAIYSAFVDGLKKGSDPSSGGAPQIVGLRRIGCGLRFGTIYRDKRYLAGARVTQKSARAADTEWFTELFERADGGRASRLPSAQTHRRPPGA